MCGLGGFIAQDVNFDATEKLKKCATLLLHRGPDTYGLYRDGRVNLLHTRLKILDLSDKASQPFVYKNIVLSYNGEIYNYSSIKKELQLLKYNFDTESDTEVLAAAYIHWGIDFLNKIEGMFAIAIYDKKKQKVLLARDIFGEKPLYYSRYGGLSFFSELNPFHIIINDLKKSIVACNHFLSIGYILHPHTPYQDVFMLSPASYLLYDISNDTHTFSTFFNVANQFRNKISLNESEIVSVTKMLVEKAITKRIMGDVPWGVFLSGGLDSAIISSVTRERGYKPPCFNACFKSVKGYENGATARYLSTHFSCEHHEVNLDNILIENLNAFISKQDYITFDNSTFPIYELAKLARVHVKYVLTGDGADEIFGGYSTYKADRLNTLFLKAIPILRANLFQTFIKSFGTDRNDSVGWHTKASRFLTGIDTDARVAHYNWRKIFSLTERINIIGNNHAEEILDSDPIKHFKNIYDTVTDLDIQDQHRYVDIKTWLTDNILIKLDRSTMSVGLEARSVYLDKELFSFAASCPPKLLIDKRLLKNATTSFLPSSILNGSKRGFNSPVAHWFSLKEDEFKFMTGYIYHKKLI